MLARITPYNGTKSTVASTNVSEGTRKMAQSPKMRAYEAELRRLTTGRVSLELELSQSKAAYKQQISRMYAEGGNYEQNRVAAVEIKKASQENSEPLRRQLREVVASIDELKLLSSKEGNLERHDLFDMLSRIEEKLDILISRP